MSTSVIALVVFGAIACGGGGGSSGSVSTGGPLTPTPVLSTVTIAAAGGTGGLLVVGQALQLTVAARDQSGLTISAAVAWSTSSPSVATVTSGGLVSAVGAGSATITATATAGTATVSSTFGVTVVGAPVLTSVVVSGTIAMTVGQSSQLTATARDQNGAAMTATVAWSSTAPTIAAVSGSGLVTAIAVGGATITALATVGPTSVSGTATVSVAAPTPILSSVSITPATAALQVGQSVQFAATTLDQSGSPIAATAIWATNAPNIATITQGGLVTAVASGSVSITVQASVSGGASLSATRLIAVTAAAPVLTSIVISGPSQTVTVGQTLQLTATARDQNGAVFGAAVTWSSANTSRATVSSSGLVSGVAAGAVTISASATAGSITVSDGITVTVQAPLVLTAVVVSGSSTVAAGSTIQLAASPRDQNGNPIAGATLAWSSNATGVATVNAGTGLVTGVSAGPANISVLATLGSATASAFQTITVTAGFPASASVTTPGLSFAPGSVDISAAGTVTWTINSNHNVTFNAAAGVPANIPTGPQTTGRTFNSGGTFTYFCSVHPVMTGTVIVH